jgi:hypothetical protein
MRYLSRLINQWVLQGGKKVRADRGERTYMNVFLPKFLVQTLRKRPKRKLGSRE